MKKVQIWDPYKDFQQTTLPNGVAVHSAFWNRPCIHVRISVHSGSLSDPKGKEGLAHFVEHMLNSDLEKNQKTIAGLGGEADFGGTGHFFTEFTFTVPIDKHSIVKSIKIFEKMLGDIPNDLFLEKEKDIILEEFFRKYPLLSIHEMRHRVYCNAYQGTLFENFMGGLGVPETIKNFSIGDVQNFFLQHYVPSNMSVFVVGGLKHGEVVKYVQENFSLLMGGEKERVIPKTLPEICFPKNTGEVVSISEILKGIISEHSSLESFLVVPGSFSYEALRICRFNLRKILMHEIREKKHATYDVEVVLDIIGGCYEIMVDTIFDLKNLELVKKIFMGSFEKIRNRKVFERTRKDLVVGYQTNDSNMKTVCHNAQIDFIKFGRIITCSDEIENLQAVSFEEYCKLVDFLADPKRWWSLIQVP